METFKNTIVEFLTTTGLRLVIGAAVLVVGWILINFAVRKAKAGKMFAKMDPTAKGFILTCFAVLLKVALVVTVAAYLGIPMTSFVAILGAMGLAVGLALQGSLANFAGGLMLLIFRPFKVGDFVEANGSQGVVQSISILYTKLLTLDNRAVLIPNGSLSNNTVINFSAEDTRRVDLVFNAAFDSDVERVKAVLLVIAEKNEMVLKDPAPFARLSGKNDSGLEFTLRAWTKKENYWDVYFDLLENVKLAFDKVGIVVPYKQVDVHMKNDAE